MADNRPSAPIRYCCSEIISTPPDSLSYGTGRVSSAAKERRTSRYHTHLQPSSSSTNTVLSSPKPVAASCFSEHGEGPPGPRPPNRSGIDVYRIEPPCSAEFETARPTLITDSPDRMLPWTDTP